MSADLVILLLRISIAVTMVAFGLDQLSNPQRWLRYIPKFVARLLPLSPTMVMRIHAIVNIFLGGWLLIGIALDSSLVLTLAWWISILPFAWWYSWRIGLRDTVIVISLAYLLIYF